MSKRKLEFIIYAIFLVVCVAVAGYEIWKEKLDIEYKQATIQLSEEVLNEET